MGAQFQGWRHNSIQLEGLDDVCELQRPLYKCYKLTLGQLPAAFTLSLMA
jgi:hypothetical protein